MRGWLVLTVVIGLLVPVVAEECALVDGVYGQPSSNWELRFVPVPRDGAANQTAAFVLDIPTLQVSLDGAVHQPNGFSQSWGSVEGQCAPGADGKAASCRFWEGVVYAGQADGIAVLGSDDSETAPDQVLLPEFASAIWYSAYREAFMGAEPGDVFTRKGCAPVDR